MEAWKNEPRGFRAERGFRKTRNKTQIRPAVNAARDGVGTFPLGFRWGLIVNFGKTRTLIKWVSV